MDLEKEIEKYYYEHFAFLSNPHIPTLTIVSDIARHFYDLSKPEHIRKNEVLRWAIDTKMALEKDCSISKDFRRGASYMVAELVTKLNSM